MTLYEVFTSGFFWPPFISTLLMCCSSALIGSILVIQKKALLVETVSHASLLGLVLGAFYARYLLTGDDAIVVYLVGAFIIGLISMKAVSFLQNTIKFSEDSALCFILSGFMGVGLLLASVLQRVAPLQYKQMLTFLYGQPSLLNWSHCAFYGIFCAVLIIWLFVSFRSIKTFLFDKEFAISSGLASSWTDGVLCFFSTLAIIIGLKSVGVILLGGVLVASAVTGKLLARKLSTLFIIAGCVGILSAVIGTFATLWIAMYSNQSFVLADGPFIVIASFVFCFIALLFSKRQGVFSIFFRQHLQYHRTLNENILKALWKEPTSSIDVLSQKLGYSTKHIAKGLKRLRLLGFINKGDNALTLCGKDKAVNIIRKHRLWECYQAQSLDKNLAHLHQSAEEFEHIIDSKTEKELEEILSYPQEDPHHQPIPKGEGRCTKD